VHQAEEGLKVRQALVPGRTGQEPRLIRSNSEESIATDISQLTCSTIREEHTMEYRRKRKKKATAAAEKKEPEAPKPDWVKMARERRGYVLNKFIQRDAGLMDAYVGGQATSDAMTSEERKLLTRTAYSRGIGALPCKSQSTENVVSNCVRPPQSGASNRSSGHLPSGTRRSKRCPSPRVAALSDRRKRSQSVTAEIRPAPRRPEGRLAFPLPTPFAPPPRLPSACSAHVGVDALDPLQDEEVMAKLQTTMNNLQRSTGYGDDCHVMSVMPDERGRFTDVDYARITRFPQHIRVAPQLSRVIRKQVRERITRPKKYSVKEQDLQKLNAENPILQRTHQNLLIYNWLNSLDGDFSQKDAPSIYDLEKGVAPAMTVYPRIYSEVINGASSMVGHTEATSVRSTQDNLEDNLADLDDEEWASELPVEVIHDDDFCS
jgi:hypothetical protein